MSCAVDFFISNLNNLQTTWTLFVFSQGLIEFRLVNFIAFSSLFSYVCKNAERYSTSFIITVKYEPLFFSNIFYVKTLVSLLKFSLISYIILLFILSMIELSNLNPYGLFIKSLQVLGSILLQETKKKDRRWNEFLWICNIPKTIVD